MSELKTPYYLIDEARLADNMRVVDRLRELSGAKLLLALKCFASWGVFDLMRQHMDGTTSSSLYEVRLGQTRFGGETHAYSVAYSDDEIEDVVSHADKIIFNSISQLTRFEAESAHIVRGLRLNPGASSSQFDLADPSRPFSRLGEHDPKRIETVIDKISGFMVHNNCENGDFDLFDDLPVADADIPDLTIYIVGRIKYPAARYSQHAPRMLLIDVPPVPVFMRRVPP